MFPGEIGFLRPGEKVRIFIHSGEKRYVFISRIKDVTSNLGKVEGPYEEEISSLITPGTKLKISLMSHFDTEKGLPVIDTSVTHYSETPLPLISFSTKEATLGWEKKRKYSRYKATIPVRCRWETGEEKSKWSTNISEKGILLSSFLENEIKIGNIFQLNLFIPSGKEIVKAKGKVTRLDPIGDDKYQAAFEFVSMDQASWNTLIGYIT
ncbi:MAG: flagellar brake protein [bacterium]|nr:flagellar brake protein [bacterium]